MKMKEKTTRNNKRLPFNRTTRLFTEREIISYPGFGFFCIIHFKVLFSLCLKFGVISQKLKRNMSFYQKYE